jgi:hypothetical protein
MVSIKYSKFMIITDINKINAIFTWILDYSVYETTPCESIHFLEK